MTTAPRETRDFDYLTDHQLNLMATAYGQAWHSCAHRFFMDHHIDYETAAIVRGQVSQYNVFQQELDAREQERINALQDRNDP